MSLFPGTNMYRLILLWSLIRTRCCLARVRVFTRFLRHTSLPVSRLVYYTGRLLNRNETFKKCYLWTKYLTGNKEAAVQCKLLALLRFNILILFVNQALGGRGQIKENISRLSVYLFKQESWEFVQNMSIFSSTYIR